MAKTPTPARLAHLMRTFRDACDLSVDEAGTTLGLSPRTIEGIEQGRGFPSAPVVLEIALEFLIAGAKK